MSVEQAEKLAVFCRSRVVLVSSVNVSSCTPLLDCSEGARRGLASIPKPEGYAVACRQHVGLAPGADEEPIPAEPADTQRPASANADPWTNTRCC
ncbi:hypothetical protein V5799_031873 [Amblyomma americanum]|uniref:Uncharacterized protein n=1 Tax=Amblyomma americanum TaxID=6943 RepID=A0AAQ4DST4_AMBAM